MTGFSAGYGPEFDGNSILVLLDSKTNRYVYIGYLIYEFNAPEPITDYYSAVGNSDVPYPVALSKNFVYFMLGTSNRQNPGGEYINRKEFSKGIDWSDAYGEYYEKFPIKRKDRKEKAHYFDGVELIHNRIW